MQFFSHFFSFLHPWHIDEWTAETELMSKYLNWIDANKNHFRMFYTQAFCVSDAGSNLGGWQAHVPKCRLAATGWWASCHLVSSKTCILNDRGGIGYLVVYSFPCMVGCYAFSMSLHQSVVCLILWLSGFCM